MHDAWSVSGGGSYTQTDAGSVIGTDNANGTAQLWIKLTGAAFSNGLLAYSWVEVEPQTSVGQGLFVEKSSGLSGTVSGVNEATETSQPAYESSTHGPLPHSNTAGLINTVVPAFRGYGGYYLFSMSPDVEMVLCTSDAPDENGCYDGIVQIYDPVARTWVNAITGVCLVDGSGGGATTFTGSLPNGTGGTTTVVRGLITASLAATPSGNQVYASSATPGAFAIPAYRALVQHDLPALFYRATSAINVANTTTETSLLGGTQTFAADTFNAAGRSFRIRMWGTWNTDGVAPGTVRCKIKLGSTTIGDTGAFNAPIGFSNADWFLEADATFTTVGSSGNILLSGWLKWVNAVTFAQSAIRLSDHTGFTINTTTGQQVNVTFQWGTADTDNSLWSYNCTIEVLQ